MIPSLSKLQEWRCNPFKENWNGFNSICLYKSIPCCVPLGSGTVICLVLPVFGSVTVWTSFWIGFPVFGSVTVTICPVAPGWIVFRAPPGWCEDVAAVDS